VVNRRPGWRRHLPALLYLLALAALILALARPQATVLAPKEQATVMLVMDVSGSRMPSMLDLDRTRRGQWDNGKVGVLG
jgi:Ca-activated chloride channel family protein